MPQRSGFTARNRIPINQRKLSKISFIFSVTEYSVDAWLSISALSVVPLASTLFVSFFQEIVFIRNVFLERNEKLNCMSERNRLIPIRHITRAHHHAIQPDAAANFLPQFGCKFISTLILIILYVLILLAMYIRLISSVHIQLLFKFISQGKYPTFYYIQNSAVQRRV